MIICKNCGAEHQDMRDEVNYVDECRDCTGIEDMWTPSFHFQPQFDSPEAEEAYLDNIRQR